MRVLIVGGAGYVGRLMLGGLAARHEVRVFDLKPPAPSPDGRTPDHVIGDATDAVALGSAMSGVDAVVHAAMGNQGEWNSTAWVPAAFTVNVTSVYLSLRAAAEAGVPHAVHLSSTSVFEHPNGRDGLTEADPLDATDCYGLTKQLAERVCEYATRTWPMSVTALRLAMPTPDEDWPAWQNAGRNGDAIVPRRPDGGIVPSLAASDLTNAVLAALDHRDGFQAYNITGDTTHRTYDMTRARQRLGWRPLRTLPAEPTPPSPPGR